MSDFGEDYYTEWGYMYCWRLDPRTNEVEIVLEDNQDVTVDLILTELDLKNMMCEINKGKDELWKRGKQ